MKQQRVVMVRSLIEPKFKEIAAPIMKSEISRGNSLDEYIPFVFSLTPAILLFEMLKNLSHGGSLMGSFSVPMQLSKAEVGVFSYASEFLAIQLEQNIELDSLPYSFIKLFYQAFRASLSLSLRS